MITSRSGLAARVGYLKSLTCWFLALLSFAAYGQGTDWKYEKTVEEIKVYSRKSGKIKEIRIETTFDAALSQVVETVLDVPGFPKWIYKVSSAAVIKKMGTDKVLYRNVIDMPWPATDRDVVVLTTVKQNLATKVVTTEDVNEPDGSPRQKGLVRIEDFYAKWTFEPSGNQVKGTYFFHSDPGGDVPDWMVNLFVDEGPVASVKALKRRLPAYKGKSSHGISD